MKKILGKGEIGKRKVSDHSIPEETELHCTVDSRHATIFVKLCSRSISTSLKKTSCP